MLPSGGGREVGEGSAGSWIAGSTPRTRKGSWPASMFSKRAIVVRLRSKSQLGEEGKLFVR